jgi:hypothetical protein
MLNVDTLDLSSITDQKSRDFRGTYCSTPSCGASTHSSRGALVHVGAKYLTRCPLCKRKDFLFFDTVTPFQAHQFRARKAAKDGL